MSGISLTASMRSNLLSLQNISGQVSSTQNKLATGNKVNSAIDNPGSYYTALSLNNRADDLNALLDSMGQAVSTIKAATTALESAAGFLEQASAVATQALETAKVPSKSFFEEKVGENGAVVTTAQELKDAVAAGKETICVYGAIDYFENENIVLKTGQKLVGTEYFTGYTGQEKFSQLNFNSSQPRMSAIEMAEGSLVSDLSINYVSKNEAGDFGAIKISGVASDVSNVDIKISASDVSTNVRGGIFVTQNGSVNVKGIVNIVTEGEDISGMLVLGGGEINILSDAITNFEINSSRTSFGIYLSSQGILNIEEGGVANFVTPVSNIGINLWENSVANIYGMCNFSSGGLFSSADKNNALTIYNTAVLSYYDNVNTLIRASTGTALSVEKGTTILDASTSKKYVADSYKSSQGIIISKDNIATVLQCETQDSVSIPVFDISKPEKIDKSSENLYGTIINQYDSLIKDAGYKGINLLQKDKLSVKFNEDSTASLDVQGKDMSSKALGFTVFDWQTQGDIAESLSEIASALKSIRNYSAELGNNYSIITTRQDFTESLVNVLTEGADKLTLADMNEESANMLALQTRQQLAINSLSLASQASQSILKLF